MFSPEQLVPAGCIPQRVTADPTTTCGAAVIERRPGPHQSARRAEIGSLSTHCFCPELTFWASARATAVSWSQRCGRYLWDVAEPLESRPTRFLRWQGTAFCHRSCKFHQLKKKTRYYSRLWKWFSKETVVFTIEYQSPPPHTLHSVIQLEKFSLTWKLIFYSLPTAAPP